MFLLSGFKQTLSLSDVHQAGTTLENIKASLDDSLHVNLQCSCLGRMEHLDEMAHPTHQREAHMAIENEHDRKNFL